MIYLIWEFLAIFLSKAKINKKRAVLFLASILWLIMALRSWDLGINDTRGIFFRDFSKLSGVSLKQALEMQPFIYEPLMNIYTWLLSKLFLGNFQIFIAISSLISTITIARIVIKKSKKPIYGLIVYFSMFYFYQSFMIKQMIALTFVVMAFESLHERKLWKYLVLIIIAGMFHKSAYLLIFMYPICKYIKFSKKFFVILLGGMAFGILGGNYIINILYKLSLYNFRLYIEERIYTTDAGFNFSMILFPMICFLCYRFRNKVTDNNNQNDYFTLLFIGCLLNSWSIIVVEFYRVAIYFLISIIFIIPNTMENVPKRYRKIGYVVFLMFFCLYAFKSAINCNCLPYKVFF